MNKESFIDSDKGKFDVELVNRLLNYNNTTEEDYFNEIHITSDGMCNIIEWECIPYDRQYGGEFLYIPEDKLDEVKDVLLGDFVEKENDSN